MSTLTSTIMGAVDRAREPEMDTPLTEAGAAERFVRFHGDDLRRDHLQRRWLLWNGHRWVKDEDAAVTRVALDFVRSWQRCTIELGSTKHRDATVRLALSLERREKLKSLLAFAGELLPIADAGVGWDANPWLLQATNGVIDLRTGVLRPGRREDRITMSCGLPYDPQAECPRFERFVREIFGGDEALVGFIHRAIGYTLTGDTREQCLFLCIGEGCNGKSSLQNAIKLVMGDYALALAFSALEFDPRAGGASNELAAVAGKRFVVSSEATEGRRLDEAKVKALTGTDSIRARFLYSNSFEFRPAAKFWLAANHRPVVRDDSAGFWRRIRLVPFQHKFGVDGALGEALSNEAAGILAWAVRGCLEWQRVGLTPPARVLAATREYQQDSDQLSTFIEESLDLRPEAEVRATDLYDAYVKWATDHRFSDRERLTSTAFGLKATDRFKAEKRRAGKFYIGVCPRRGDGCSVGSDGFETNSRTSSLVISTGEVSEKGVNPSQPFTQEVGSGNRF